jgi:hypothetical protein
MDITGTTHGNQINLDQPLSYPDGTRVRVDVTPINSPRRGSPASILDLAGTLSDAEADAILKGAQESRRVDPSLWNGKH